MRRLSLNNPHVLGLLRARGFDADDRREGWELFETATGRHLNMDDIIKVAASPNKALIAEIDEWENTWFEVADAALSRKFPKVHERIFKNLSKTSGVQVVVTVGTLLNRLDELEIDGSGENVAAISLLAQRGLDNEQRDKARGLLTKAEDGSIMELPSPEAESEKQRQKAIEDMWAWYKDWAQTARTVVKAKRLRINMGLSQPTRQVEEDEEEDKAEPVPATPEAQPAPQPVSTPM